LNIDPRLEKISPLWYQKILRCKTLKGLLRKTTVQNGLITRKLDLADYGCCMVGESYGFDKGYCNESMFNPNPTYCKECFKFSETVIIPSRDIDNYEIKNFQVIISDFLDHVEKVHGVKLT